MGIDDLARRGFGSLAKYAVRHKDLQGACVKGKERRWDGGEMWNEMHQVHALSAKHTPNAAPAFDLSQTITTRVLKERRFETKTEHIYTLLFGPCILFFKSTFGSSLLIIIRRLEPNPGSATAHHRETRARTHTHTYTQWNLHALKFAKKVDIRTDVDYSVYVCVCVCARARLSVMCSGGSRIWEGGGGTMEGVAIGWAE